MISKRNGQLHLVESTIDHNGFDCNVKELRNIEAGYLDNRSYYVYCTSVDSIQTAATNIFHLSCAASSELHHLTKDFKNTVIMRASPVPSPSIIKRRRIISSKIEKIK